MKSTRYPVRRVQEKFVAMRTWPNVVGQLPGQRLFCRLGLKVVVIFLFLGIVRRTWIGGRGNHKRIACRVRG